MKKLKYCLFALIPLFGFIFNIKAVSINSSSSVYVGNTVKVSVNCSGSAGNLSLSSSDRSIFSTDSASQWCDNNTIYFYASAKSAGTATLTVSGVVSDSGVYKDYNVSKSVRVTAVNRSNNTNSKGSVDVNKKYSSNNYLKNLTVDGYELSPKFDKDKLEYKLELDSSIEKININAIASDDNANVKGAGEVSVSEGINTINIVVAAENGNEKTYKIIVDVKEKNPIKVKIGKKNYTVVKKEKLLGTKEGYTLTTIDINGEKIPALYSESTKVTLVGLKDNKGNIELFSYNTKNGKYTKYIEMKFSLVNLYIHEAKNSKYKKIYIKINDKKVPAYKIEGVDDYYLLYATNITTGYKGYYLYDEKENTAQRYNDEILSKLMGDKDKYLSIVTVLSCVCFLCMLFLLIQVNKERKK